MIKVSTGRKNYDLLGEKTYYTSEFNSNNLSQTDTIFHQFNLISAGTFMNILLGEYLI